MKDQLKQYLELIREEINVKVVKLTVGKSEEGLVEVCYDGKRVYYTVGDEERGEPSETVCEAIMSNFLNKNAN